MHVITVIPYVDKIYSQNYLGELVTFKQRTDTHSHFREININYNRNDLQQVIRDNYKDVDLVLLMDSDVIATKEQLQALLDNFKGTPLALKTKTFSTGQHICCACCLLTLQDYLSIKYIDEYIDECQCTKIMKLFDVKYLEGQQAYEYRDIYIQTNEFHGLIVPEYKIEPTPGISPINQ